MQVTSIGRKFKVIGHRGNPGNPLNTKNIENTIPSFKSAWKLGADAIELDTILSEDGVLMVHHDDYLGRTFYIQTTPEQGLIGEYTADQLTYGTQLNSYGLGHSILDKILDPEYKDHINIDGNNLLPKNKHLAKIPRLDEVRIPLGKKLFLELKFINDKLGEDKQYLDNLVKKAIEFIQENGLPNQIYVLCFVPEALDKIKNLNDKIITAYNIYQGEASDLKKLEQLQKDYGFDIVNPPLDQATKEAIDNIHSLELKTYPWVWKEGAKKEIAEVRRLLNEGADGVITNQVEETLNAICNIQVTPCRKIS